MQKALPAYSLISQHPDITWTVRQVYYRLVSNQVIPNTQTSYKQFDRQLTKLREYGEIPDEVL